MLIRRMEGGDVEPAVELARANYDAVMAEHHTAEILAGFRADVTPRYFREQMSCKQVFVAEDAGEVVATGALADFGTTDAPKHVVSQFYVRSDLHRRGIGTRLLAHIVEVAIDAGADCLHVPSSRNAIPFYESAAFVVDAAQPDAAIEITWMTKPLLGRSTKQAHRAGSQ
jgi:GNAT superfamily N-acetyltransferase